MSKEIKDFIPPTAWKTELRKHIEESRLKNPDTHPSNFVSARQQQMRQEEIHRIPTNVPLIQVEIKPDGRHESVFVSPEHVSMRAEIDRECELLSPTDMSALFNMHFRSLDCDPGFEMYSRRHKLFELGLAEVSHRRCMLTADGEDFIEEMLEFHQTVFRPIRYEETFLPLPDNILQMTNEPRPLRLMERREKVSKARRIPENTWKKVDMT